MNRYIALQKAVEFDSFTKAADTLGYTQSAVSRMIVSLENELSIQLLCCCYDPYNMCSLTFNIFTLPAALVIMKAANDGLNKAGGDRRSKRIISKI